MGSSINLSRRFRQYFSLAYLQGHKGSSHINRALLKYGYYSFSLEILEYCDSKDVISREQYYIDLLKPEYNILPTAGSLLGFKHSEEALKKREANKGENHPFFGKAHSEETKGMAQNE